MGILDQGNCIYCNLSNDFTEEHVFPAGMGGDDRSFLLKEGVCTDCNTKIFSVFEATLMRRSVVALARAINQPKSRNGKNSTYDPIEVNIIDEEGRRLESCYTEGLKAEILPQLIYNGETIDSAATTKADLHSFTHELAKILNKETISLIEKKNTNTKNKFIIHTYSLTSSAYVLREKYGIDKPPKNCLWIQYQTPKPNDTSTTPKIYRRAKGQLVIKVPDLSAVGIMLLKIRATLPSILTSSIDVDEEEHPTPLATTTSLAWSSECDRAIAKIGVNLLAFQEGLESARHPSLDPIKNFILRGTPSPQAGFLPNEDYRSKAFGIIPKGHHCLALSLSKNPDSTLTANIAMVLYGTTGVGVTLSNNGVSGDTLSINYYLINYTENTITKYNFMEYHNKYNPEYIEKVTRATLGNFFR